MASFGKPSDNKLIRILVNKRNQELPRKQVFDKNRQTFTGCGAKTTEEKPEEKLPKISLPPR